MGKVAEGADGTDVAAILPYGKNSMKIGFMGLRSKK